MTKRSWSLSQSPAALRNGQVSARELVEDCLAAHDPALEAYQYWQPDRSRAQAELADSAFANGIDLGPLQGIPVSVKDIYGLTGYPTCAGTPSELPAPWCEDGPFISRGRRQLPAIMGKTRTVEFAFGGIGTNPHWPRVRNPWDRERVAGGSSTGGGVSIAEGSCLLAFGTDTAGSVRVPASFTGCAGLKTTIGRWPIGNIVPLSPTLDTPGIIARSVEDLALGFAALDGREASWRSPSPVDADLSGLRIAVPSGLFFDKCEPGIAEAVHAALAEVEAAGARLVSVDMPGAEEAYDLFLAGSVQAPEIYEFLQTHMPERMETLCEIVRLRVRAGADMPAAEYLRRRRRIAELAGASGAAFRDVDLFAAPTVPISPPRFDEVEEIEDYRARNLLALRNTTISNLLDFTALTLPAGLDALGLPVGLQLMSPAMSEPRLLDIGRRIEAVIGTGEQRIGRPKAV